jgi:PhnB protein
MPYKPDTYPALSPYVIASDARALIDFIAATFDASRLALYEREDGSVMHAELRIDDSVVMLGEANEGWPAVPSHLHVYVADVDATYAKALSNGAESLQPPTKGDDPDRRGGVRDPVGNTWWISTRVG